MNERIRELADQAESSTQGWYLRWDKETSHTMFVLKWN